ncbi:hypothetical protein RZA67_09800 [Stenotrophomonas sp. C3(2023)]|uniref:hypothetical protein n=1 Tax=Stenotrophomonas sp. C3(2023) TaxID=3080277 RepID=UPI00293CC0F5|nr:hypothetical protein [Stenotrophomonas sp. C3(2023)]MDV3469022.1 hypothetical protein [Stenotrophomonas sp. C3(2023)]
MRVIVIATAAALLAACAGQQPRANPPAPDVVEVPVATYVPIDAALTKRCSWIREGRPSQVFAVSNGRKRCLLQYEAQLEGVEQVQGKPVPTPD